MPRAICVHALYVDDIAARASAIANAASAIGMRPASVLRFPFHARHLLDKVWQAHTVRRLPNGQTQLFIGLHLIHEVTTPQAFDMLRARGLAVRCRSARSRPSITSCPRSTAAAVPRRDGRGHAVGARAQLPATGSALELDSGTRASST
jgi:hypothetical protein